MKSLSFAHTDIWRQNRAKIKKNDSHLFAAEQEGFS